jgi:archaellum component FlaC
MSNTTIQTIQTIESIDIKSLLCELLEKVNTLQQDVNIIKSSLQKIDANCERMDGHISFVENTYDTLKYPIQIFKNKIEQVFGKNVQEEHKMIK